MSLKWKPPLLLVVLVACVSGKVAQTPLRKSFRHGGPVGGKFDVFTDGSLSMRNGDYDHPESDATVVWGQGSDERYSDGGFVKRPKKVMHLASLERHSVIKSETNLPDLSLSCNEQTKVFRSAEPRRGGTQGFISARALASCGYAVTKEQEDTLIPLKDCDVTLVNGRCSTRLKYEANGQLADITLPCTAHYPTGHSNGLSSLDLLQSDSPSDTPDEFKCNIPNLLKPAPKPPASLPLIFGGPNISSAAMAHKHSCIFPTIQRILCGGFGILAVHCLAKGCCVDIKAGTCFYPMDECTADSHFAFLVPHNPSLRLDLTKLKASDCAPKILTDKFAVFLFSFKHCGTLTYDIGATTIYSVEVSTTLAPIPAISGTISRERQFRMMVECRYHKGQQIQPQQYPNHLSTGFMVKSPSIPMVRSEGSFTVQLKLARDQNYTNWYPLYHPPLRLMLGRPVYLEVSLQASNVRGVLIVHYCIAYPRAAKKALVLLYEGCPNPDKFTGVTIHKLPGNQHARRFEVKAFQFMVAANKYLDEEIYFMCSTELCLPEQGVCEEGCFKTL
ncbi:hypothetical protein AAFF_G00192000 [Aldrovandia affinis]|uniref:ZP domain-containing protein n=1 Tax=Aldrovandia affinis TaxID=143900 RepID=A0AAD7RJ40_9TELE|nr:hypothetical protein AAFF_G00192000 [Aldrovandia affinis]